MAQLVVKAKKLNKRSKIPLFLSDPDGIVGVVKEGFIFEGEQVIDVPNPDLGKWYRDRDGHFYWGGGLNLNLLPGTTTPAPIKPETAVSIKIENAVLNKLQIDQIWNEGEMGDKATVAILDSGIALNCPDLTDAAGAGIGGGFPNASKRMKNFVDGSTSLNDDKGHGSHCAGIIASRNNQHAAGIAKQCKLYVGKITDAANTPSVTNMLKGLRWAGGLEVDSPRDIDIISMSNGSLLNIPDMKPTIAEILSKGKIIVCSIGNRGPGSLPSGGTFPAMFDGVISVGSVDLDNNFQDFSFEFANLTISCPGTNVVSYWIDGQTRFETGTSQSTAVCAGVIALLVSRLRKIGEQNIQLRILSLLSNANSKTKNNGFTYRFLEPLNLFKSI